MWAKCNISIFLHLCADARSDVTICFIQMINYQPLIHTLFIRIINFNTPLSLYFILSLITAFDWGAPGFLAISEKDIGFLSLFGLFSVFFTTCAGCSWQRRLFNDYKKQELILELSQSSPAFVVVYKRKKLQWWYKRNKWYRNDDKKRKWEKHWPLASLEWQQKTINEKKHWPPATQWAKRLQSLECLLLR